jgi:hypothetical protein
MKKRVLLGLLTIVAILFLGFKNEPEGFRGYKWGATHEECLDLVFVEEDKEGYSYYVNPNEKLTIGSAKLSSIEYIFWNDILEHVVVTIHGLRN